MFNPNFISGWGRKLGYCIAFSRDGAADVTRRYVRNFSKDGADRTRCPEAVLLYILDEIRALRRRDMTKQERFALKGEDMREDFELSSYVAQSLVQELSRSLDKHNDSQKAAEARQNGESPYLLLKLNISLIVYAATVSTTTNGSSQTRHQPPR